MLATGLKWLIVGSGATLLSYFALGMLRPYLVKNALASPNHRSSHKQATPQGAGLVVVPVALGAAGLLLLRTSPPLDLGLHLLIIGAGAIGLMLLGFYDDRAPLPITTRLVGQLLLVSLVIAAMPIELRVATIIPLPVERILMVLAVLWAINLTNFMDGIDWISAVETIAITVGIAVAAGLELIPMWLGSAAIGLLGATIGFMPWNAHPARMFLGDAGSLPLGLLLALLLIHVAAAGAFIVAIILPLYYLADASLTLVLRLLRGQRVWEAHRDHFYQRALRSGWTVHRVVFHVFALNATLVLIALISAGSSTLVAKAIGFALALLATGATLYKMGRADPRP